ncbi:Translation factor pelota [Spiromyces aspiralis]|uniref:Translation factor pelota n=1 Tax=Spiromyces aspiralis TaxID=68401 RepID=A0ACC1HH32_9FUNG|nr:Translation factor pelota [Spiromyces aspiralis]
MKLLRKNIEKDQSGFVRLEPEESEDMWHLYNLIQKGDQVEATTVRYVPLPVCCIPLALQLLTPTAFGPNRGVKSESSTGSVSTQRVRTKLRVNVRDIFFDIQAGALRINGQNVLENKFLGQFHTIDLELKQPFMLFKPTWDTISLQRVKDACDVTKQADAAAVVMQDGLANVCLLTQHMTIVRQRVEVHIPRKNRGSATNYEKAIGKFYDQVYRSIKQHIDFGVVKVVVLGSPGFVKDKFFKYMLDQAKEDNKTIMTNKPKFVLVHTSSGHKRALEEVMQDPQIKVRLADTKAAEEGRALDEFYKIMNDDPDRAYYGFDHVRRACENHAIGTLMITDELFRSADLATRRKYVKLVEDTQALKGRVLIFSSLHVSGEQLQQLSGVAAILNFPLPEVESEAES